MGVLQSDALIAKAETISAKIGRCWPLFPAFVAY